MNSVPLLVIAGKEYGSGSSRDWAAKGTQLLGVQAVIAESFERIHRSNLVNMGVLPLEFKSGENAASLKLTGTESFDLLGVAAGLRHRGDVRIVARDGRRGRDGVRCDRPDRHARGAPRVPPRRHPAVRSAAADDKVERRSRASALNAPSR